jgi:cytochrome c peroxidase
MVLAHYNTAPEAPAGHSELEPLKLTHTELSQLMAFLHTLNGPLDMPSDMPSDPLADSSLP